MASKSRQLDIKLKPPGTWVSYVGCVASVLNARGIRRDEAEVAGLSGYAFLVNIEPRLCPSGPTAFNMDSLVEGTSALGLETTLSAAPRDPADDPRLARGMFERVQQEIDAGRPAVVWGVPGAPEFGIVYGYFDESYRVRSYRTFRKLEPARRGTPLGPNEVPEDPVRYDKLNAPGCWCLFQLGEPAEHDPQHSGREAVARATALLRDRHHCYMPGYVHGGRAFETWAGSLENDRELNAFGNAYNSLCYAELQGFAAEFLDGLRAAHPRAAAALAAAAVALHRSSANLDRLGELFPFPQGSGLDDPKKVSQAAALLRACAALNDEAASALEKALGLM